MLIFIYYIFIDRTISLIKRLCISDILYFMLVQMWLFIAWYKYKAWIRCKLKIPKCWVMPVVDSASDIKCETGYYHMVILTNCFRVVSSIILHKMSAIAMYFGILRVLSRLCSVCEAAPMASSRRVRAGRRAHFFYAANNTISYLVPN